MRGIPLIALSHRNRGEPAFSLACLSAFSSAAKAWHTSKYPAHQETNAASDLFPPGNYEDDPGILIAGAIVSLSNSGITPWTVAGGMDRILTIAQQADGPASVAAFDLACSDDVRDLDEASAPAMAGTALWPGGSPPDFISHRWNELKRELINSGLGWEAWVDWYENRLRGANRSAARELAYIEVPSEFLFDGPERANTWILQEIGRLENQSEPESGLVEESAPSGPGAPPSIPAAQPAAIEPVWTNRRLTIPKAPTKTDLTGRKFVAALKSLRREMHGFATDISAEANIDKRFAAYVLALAEEIPVRLPRQEELFRLGHAQSVLAGYSKTVSDEWSPILAARYHALSLGFDRTLRQSRLWREFKRNAAKGLLTPDQIRMAGTFANDFAVVLRSDEAKELVDPAIPQTLAEVAEPLRKTTPTNNELPKDMIEAGQELLAYDLVESINNILKGIFQAAIWSRIYATAKEAGNAYTEAALKSIVTEAKQLGKHTGPALSKWTRRLILGGTGYYIAGKPLIVWAVANYPIAFNWVESAIHFLSFQ